MSQVLIQQYLNQLQDLRKVSGTHRESVVREAFKDLLKGNDDPDGCKKTRNHDLQSRKAQQQRPFYFRLMEHH
jgi:hypothetical protein